MHDGAGKPAATSPEGTPSQHNFSAYRDAQVVASYRRERDLLPPERVILARLAPALRGRPLLDIGVGAGRTTPHLLALSRDYTGIDYSPEMVEAARERFPDVRIRQGDARDLSRFPVGRFALVLFSFNGLDYVSHADRLRALAQMHARLAPGGWLVFSTHNRDAVVERLDATLDPLRALARRWRHWRSRRLETHTQEYAILNDCAHDNRLMTYYISLRAQRAQLLALGGWSQLQAFNAQGEAVEEDGTSPWITWLVRRGGG